MPILVIISQVLAFGLELVLLVAFGGWAFQAVPGPVLSWIAVIAVLAVVIGLWYFFAAPKSPTRLKMPGILVFKIAIFAAGALALWGSGQPFWAGIFAALVAVHLGLAAASGTV